MACPKLDSQLETWGSLSINTDRDPETCPCCSCSAEKLPYTPLPLHLNLSWIYKDCQLIAWRWEAWWWRRSLWGFLEKLICKITRTRGCKMKNSPLNKRSVCPPQWTRVHRQTDNSKLLQWEPPGLHVQALNSLHILAQWACVWSPLSTFQWSCLRGASPADQQKAPAKCSVPKRVQKVSGKKWDWSLSSSLLSRKQTAA